MDQNLNRAYLISVREKSTPLADAERDLEELAFLAQAVDIQVVGQTAQRVTRFNPKYMLGLGTAESLKGRLASLDARLLIVDAELTPAQERNLEKLTGAKVYTRTDVILEIFGRRAATREGKLQVELAQLQYVLPRMVGMWTHFGRSMGHVGGRGGVGETQLEIDRRRARQRITQLKRQLKDVRRTRGEARKQRARHEIPTFSLVGYTNAGKSSLLNQLTQAGAFEADQLFATLDPLTERLVLPNKQTVLVSDTVGFIRHLPHNLVEAFRATLEEVVQADVLLHVVDASDEELEIKIETVHEVLQQIGVDDKPHILVMNKIDRTGGPLDYPWLANEALEVVSVSAHTGEGIPTLLAAMERSIAERMKRVHLHIPYHEGKVLADVLAQGDVYGRRDLDDGVELDVALNQILAGRYRNFVAAASDSST